MLLGRVPIALGVERLQRSDQLGAGLPWQDDFVDEPALRGHIGIGELFAVFLDLRGADRGCITRRFEKSTAAGL